MNNIVFQQGIVAMHQMPHESQCFSLAQSFILSISIKIVFEIPILAILQHHINAFSRPKIVVELDYKGRLQRFQVFNLVFYLFLYTLGDLFEVDAFNSYLHAFFILSIEDGSSGSRSNGVRLEYPVISNFLNNLFHSQVVSRYIIQKNNLITHQYNLFNLNGQKFHQKIIPLRKSNQQNNLVGQLNEKMGIFCDGQININKIIGDQLQMNGVLMAIEEVYGHGYFNNIAACVSLVILYLIYYNRYRKPHVVIKASSTYKRKNIGRPPPPYPNGWYNLMSSKQLKKGKVCSVDIAGENLVVYRGTDNVVYALQAYCLHIGANLGVGGEVVNQKCIQCPFHGWLYDGTTGNCVDYDGKPLELKAIEYNDDACSKHGKLQWKTTDKEKVKLRKFPVSEINQYIFVWIHAMAEHQQTPIYPLINIENFINKLEYRGKTEHHVMCHMQDIPQNGADTLHFKYIHSYITPLMKSFFFRWDSTWMRGDDPNLLSMFQHKSKTLRNFKQRIYKEVIEPFPHKQFLSIGNLQNSLTIPIFGRMQMFTATIIQCGLGVVYVMLKSPLYEIILHHYIQPNGRASQKVFHDIFISTYIPYWISSIASQMEEIQVTNDMQVWQAKKFARKAYLHEDRQSDMFIKNWRVWASQHYEGCQSQLKDSLSW